MKTRLPNGLPYWLASLVVPGWGQLCQGRGIAFVWAIGCALLYWFRWPVGICVHLACLCDGYVWTVIRDRSDHLRNRILRSAEDALTASSLNAARLRFTLSIMTGRSVR
jgi:TM2 domain-containing membrane protein YozV